MSNQNWKRDRAGKYVRFRRVDGTLHVDLVMKRSNGMWFYTTGAKGDENRVGGDKQFTTRMAATSALDSWIENQNKPEPEFKDEHYGENTNCYNCGGSGIWHGAGYMLNGVFQGPSGKCYRCDGKGYQTDADIKRNSDYDNYIRKIEA